MSKSSLFDALNAKKFDKRLTDWNIQEGIITKQDLENHTSQLTDDSANKVELNIKEDAKVVDSSEEAH